jgi:alcohol dehydrogenase, propanol-preferring
LLCAGIVGYRALLRSGCRPEDRLGIWGLGASAHLTAQVALAMGADLHVFTRSQAGQDLAHVLGAAWIATPGEAPTAPLDVAISCAPAGVVVADALSSFTAGVALAVAGYTSPIFCRSTTNGT